MDDSFSARYPFPLDDFQVRALDALDEGRSVLVAAPTGSGKTVVAEYAIHLARGRGRKAFYTTPLKALSNQKYGDFVARYGADEVGLLTGDNSINSEAPIVVMTTEVLRNMLYERSTTLNGLAFVVMDEVHYLQDPYRGAVWEEVLIHLQASVDLVCLSATISNAEEFGEWIGSLRGPTEVVIEERRPVPLEHHYLVGTGLHPMHVERDGHPHPNPYLASLDQRELKVKSYRRAGDGRLQHERLSRPREGHRRMYVPRREEVVEVLSDEGILPAIYFIFSRAGCDRSVRQLMAAGVRLTTQDEAERIREFTHLRAAWMEEDDLASLGYDDFAEALAAGIASHHAGMLPMFKETVEALFESGLIKVVFATETLSLGINMPARTVVIEDLWKFQGERHELLTPGEYTQLTGRAGRRGIDPIGHAVVVLQPNVPFERVASLASTRTYELRSSFRPSYNMSVNLARNYTPEQAQMLLNSSFAQFLADRSVAAAEEQLEADRAHLSNLRERMDCDLGDFREYWALREQARTIRERARRDRASARSDTVKQALAGLKPGDVVYLPAAGRRGFAAVVSVRSGRATALSQDRREKPFRLLARDFPEPPEPLARIALPRSGRAHSPKYRREVAAALAALDVSPPRRSRGASPAETKRAEALDRRAQQHPCHGCPDRPEHERVATAASRVAAAVEKTERRVRNRTETLSRRFDRVLSVLDELGYTEDFNVLAKGQTLAHIYGESDILVTEALVDDLFQGLEPAEIAAVVSTMIYESRERYPRDAALPTEATDSAYEGVKRIWRRIRRVEQQHQVELCRDPDPGFAEPVFHWARGWPLSSALAETGMTAGDFVRNCKQLIDLLRQIEEVSPEPEPFRAARAAVNRGVVAYTGV